MHSSLSKIALILAFASASFAYAHPGHDHGASSTDSLGVSVEGVTPIEAGVDASVDAEVSATTSAGMAHEEGVHTDAHGSAETTLGISERVAEGGLSESEKQSLISLDSQGIVMIKSEADVATYAEIVAEESAKVDEITVKTDSVSVTYVDSGKLFGFIPLSAKGTVDVSKSGGITVSGPWYGFMMSGLSQTEIETQLASELSGRAEATNVAFTSETEVALQARAEILHAVVSAIEASLGASAEVSAE